MSHAGPSMAAVSSSDGAGPNQRASRTYQSTSGSRQVAGASRNQGLPSRSRSTAGWASRSTASARAWAWGPDPLGRPRRGRRQAPCAAQREPGLEQDESREQGASGGRRPPPAPDRARGGESEKRQQWDHGERKNLGRTTGRREQESTPRRGRRESRGEPAPAGRRPASQPDRDDGQPDQRRRTGECQVAQARGERPCRTARADVGDEGRQAGRHAPGQIGPRRECGRGGQQSERRHPPAPGEDA